MDTTQIMEIAEADCSIKKEKFRLHTYAEFQNFAGTNLHLIDVVGQVLQIQGSNLEDSNSKQKIVLLLLLEDNSTIRLTLWDGQSSEFRIQYQRSERYCNVIVCTCLNPKKFAGKLFLNSTGATKIFLNSNLQVVNKFMKRMGIQNSVSAAAIVEERSGKISYEN
uniref:Uncharacterized protein n=1 Tax=Noccaea caerulescens TaxID=107243 RepID=A0A1J3FSC9_NOCCA